MLSSVSINAVSAAFYLQATLGVSGVSSAAQELQKASSKLTTYEMRSQALSARINSMLAELAVISTKTYADSVESVQASAVALSNARLLICALPEMSIRPDISLDGEGGIMFDWMISKFKMYSISIGRTSRLPFALLNGAEKAYGVIEFDGQKAPNRMVSDLSVMLS